jgi:hypothetical protein
MPVYATVGTICGTRSSRLAESASVSEQTIRALAGHVSRQMLEHYSHIRSHAKQAAIRYLEEQENTSVSGETGHKIGHNPKTATEQKDAKSLNGGPARI